MHSNINLRKHHLKEKKKHNSTVARHLYGFFSTCLRNLLKIIHGNKEMSTNITFEYRKPHNLCLFIQSVRLGKEVD